MKIMTSCELILNRVLKLSLNSFHKVLEVINRRLIWIHVNYPYGLHLYIKANKPVSGLSVHHFWPSHWQTVAADYSRDHRWRFLSTLERKRFAIYGNLSMILLRVFIQNGD